MHPFPELSDCNIHIWVARLECSDGAAACFERLLNDDERDRAQRFRFDHLRRSFIVRRGILRSLLGRYLKTDPDGIRFGYGSKGKPFLTAADSLQFNASDSGVLAAFAFARGCDLGIDLEQIRPMPDAEQIANRFFSVNETAEILGLPAPEREAAFFCCWTRKEAYIKAVGEGLSLPLDGFQVSVRPGEPARFINVDGSRGGARQWTLHDFAPDEGYAGAIAYKGNGRSVSVIRIPDPAELIG